MQGLARTVSARVLLIKYLSLRKRIEKTSQPVWYYPAKVIIYILMYILLSYKAVTESKQIKMKLFIDMGKRREKSNMHQEHGDILGCAFLVVQICLVKAKECSTVDKFLLQQQC